MSDIEEIRIKQILSGKDRTLPALLLRAGASVAEPIYAAAMRGRNAFFDRGIFRSRSLGRPTISVGNITTGGTGKTPVVKWLAGRLQSAGKHPVVLTRGYKTTNQGISDEQKLLTSSGIRVIANPSRVGGAQRAIEADPAIDAFILDDGMQHRKARRDFDLVLIHAVEPFGFGRVFPRGLLREPMEGLRRASALLITHAAEADEAAMRSIKTRIARFNPSAPLFRCDHAVSANIAGKKYFAFCGIGSPQSFFRALASLGGECVGRRALDDHHDYSQRELSDMEIAARSAGAEMLVTTAKDWVKVEPMAGRLPLPIEPATLTLQFHHDDEQNLFSLILSRLG